MSSFCSGYYGNLLPPGGSVLINSGNSPKKKGKTLTLTDQGKPKFTITHSTKYSKDNLNAILIIILHIKIYQEVNSSI